ncbi:MAG: hypothetical protein IZT56_02190 [Bacteroidetes bacterium]|nr:hypothetical protein [Bacteroidota bacterium]
MINTNTNQYYILLRGFVKASIETHGTEILRIKLNLLFINYYFYPLRYIGKNEKKKNIGKEKNKIRSKIGLRNGLQLLKSFKIKRFDLNIDTGDYTLNAKLYPLFLFLNNGVGHFNVNFENRNQFVLHLQNRPIDIVKSFINLKTKHYGLTF